MPILNFVQKYMTCVCACFLNVQMNCLPALFNARTIAAVCIYVSHFSFPPLHATVIKANPCRILPACLYSNSTKEKMITYALPTVALGGLAFGYWWWCRQPKQAEVLLLNPPPRSLPEAPALSQAVLPVSRTGARDRELGNVPVAPQELSLASFLHILKQLASNVQDQWQQELWRLYVQHSDFLSGTVAGGARGIKQSQPGKSSVVRSGEQYMITNNKWEQGKWTECACVREQSIVTQVHVPSNVTAALQESATQQQVPQVVSADNGVLAAAPRSRFLALTNGRLACDWMLACHWMSELSHFKFLLDSCFESHNQGERATAFQEEAIRAPVVSPRTLFSSVRVVSPLLNNSNEHRNPMPQSSVAEPCSDDLGAELSAAALFSRLKSLAKQKRTRFKREAWRHEYANDCTSRGLHFSLRWGDFIMGQGNRGGRLKRRKRWWKMISQDLRSRNQAAILEQENKAKRESEEVQDTASKSDADELRLQPIVNARIAFLPENDDWIEGYEACSSSTSPLSSVEPFPSATNKVGLGSRKQPRGRRARSTTHRSDTVSSKNKKKQEVNPPRSIILSVEKVNRA